MKKKVVLISVVTVLVAFMLVFSLFTLPIGATPVVVKPGIEDSSGENFDDEGWGDPPNSTAYTYYGDHFVDGNWYFSDTDYFGVDFDTWEGSASLNLVGEGNSTFVFAEDEYFSFDYYLLLLNGTVIIDYWNATTMVMRFIHTTSYVDENYHTGLDMDNDRHVNCFDLQMIVDAYGDSGAPGWRKEDINFDGLVNALDVSEYISEWDGGTDYHNVTWEFTYEGITYSQESYSYYHHAIDDPDGIDWLHAYNQFQYADEGIFKMVGWDAYSLSQDAAASSADWNMSDTYFLGLDSWSAVTVTTFNDTVAFLDNMTICTTPYDVTPQTYTPAMDGVVTPDTRGTHLSADFTMDFDILNNSKTPMFADAQVYMWKETPSSDSMTITIPASDYYMLGNPSTVYANAHDREVYKYYYNTEDTLMVGQIQDEDDEWYIYRAALRFDTSIIADDWDIQTAQIVLTAQGDGRTPQWTYAMLDAGRGTRWNETQDYATWKPFPFFPASGVGSSTESYDYLFYEDSDDDRTYEAFVKGVYTDDYPITRISVPEEDFGLLRTMTTLGGARSYRCLLRTSYDVTSTPTTEIPVTIFNSSRADEGKPYLQITYTIPTYSWYTVSDCETPLFIDNETVTIAEDVPVEFDTDYYWYVNYTTRADYHDDYHWEFPASGTVVGDKYCYHFTTGSYQEPTLTSFSPAHLEENVSLYDIGLVGSTFTIDSQYGLDGYADVYRYDGAWVSAGGFTYEDGVENNISFYCEYDTDIYWYVSVYEGFGSVSFPNATQTGIAYHGRKCWKFTTESNDPPSVDSYSPPIGSEFNPIVHPILINMSDTNANESIFFDMYIKYEVDDSEGGVVDMYEMIIENNRPLSPKLEGTVYYFEKGTLNLTLDEEALEIMLHGMLPNDGADFSWRIVMRDTINTVYFPDPDEWTTVFYDDFEDGTTGNYTEGGTPTDADLDSGSELGGTYSLHLQDDSGTYWFSDVILADTNDYTGIKVDFRWSVVSFDDDETFYLDYYTGSDWEHVEDFVNGVDFTGTEEGNSTVYFNESDGYVFTDDLSIRFLCAASSDFDDLYLDNIRVSSTVEWINYTVNISLDQALPTLVINYPIHNDYTIGQWMTNHDLSLTVADAEGDDIYLRATVYMIDDDDREKHLLVYQFDLNDNNIAQFALYEDDYTEEAVNNGAYTFDISWFIPFYDQEYFMIVTAHDTEHSWYGTTKTVNFTIGEPPGGDLQLSVRSLNAYNGYLEAGDILTDGLSLYIAFDGRDYSTNYEDMTNTVAFFLVDTKSNKIILNPAYRIGLGFDAWNLLTWEPSYLRDRGVKKGESYALYIGVFKAKLGFASHLYDCSLEEYYDETIDFRTPYDETMKYTDFKYEFVNIGIGELILTPPYQADSWLMWGNLSIQVPFVSGDYYFQGFYSLFGTDCNRWAAVQIVDVIRVGTNLGIGGLNYILAIAITACFLIIPYVLIKRKARNVPLSILATFGTFGVFLSFGLGLIDLWIFVPPFILLLFILIYRVAAMIMGGANALRGGGDEGVQ